MSTTYSPRGHRYVLSIAAEGALKLVKDAVVLVEVAQLVAEMIVDVDGLDGSALHVDVPDLQCEVVTRENVASILAELDIRDRRNNFREERLVAGIFFLLKH